MNELTCKRCGYRWVPRTVEPKECPSCKTRFWGTEVRHTTRGNGVVPDAATREFLDGKEREASLDLTRTLIRDRYEDGEGTMGAQSQSKAKPKPGRIQTTSERLRAMREGKS